MATGAFERGNNVKTVNEVWMSVSGASLKQAAKELNIWRNQGLLPNGLVYRFSDALINAGYPHSAVRHLVEDHIKQLALDWAVESL